MRKRAQCLSVTLVHYIDMAEDIVKLLSRPGSPIILVFFESQQRYPIPTGTPFNGVQKRGWVGKFVIFHRNRHLSRKWFEINPRLLWNTNRKS